MPLEPPRSLGRYEIQSEIGRGMMGVVYQARDPTLGRVVALKTINVGFAVSESERQVFEQRFLNEARLAAGLSHPNIVVVHDVGRDEATGTPYIALEYLKGDPLSERVPPPLDWREALRIVARLGDALHHAHAQGIVHRDIKPANVMLLGSGEPKIMDFGIARAPASNLTVAGEFFGTPSYMSPEQAAGDPVDGRSDLFSLGAVLYFLLTARRAFDGKSVPAILSKVEREDPAPPSGIVAGIPPGVDTIVQRLVEKKPERRYSDGTQLAQDIEDVLNGRAPRHATYEPTLVADVTLEGLLEEVAAAPAPEPAGSEPAAATGTATAAEIGTSTAAAPAAHRGALPLAGVAAVALLAGLLLARRPGSAPEPSSEPPVPAPLAASPDAGAAPATLPAETPVPPAPTPVATPTPAAQPSHPAASPTAAAAAALPAPQPPTPRATPAATASLTLAVEHGVKRGMLRVLVDQKPVLERPLTSEETRKAVFLKGRKGRLLATIAMSPGDHMIRVEVQDGDETPKAGVVTATFAKAETRLLEVKVGGSLELNWR